MDRWESFIIRLDILMMWLAWRMWQLRIFHYSPWYTYFRKSIHGTEVENLSLFALIYLADQPTRRSWGWESFIIRLDILRIVHRVYRGLLRIFHYSPWYTYSSVWAVPAPVENLSLFALIYLGGSNVEVNERWESFIIRLDILRGGTRGGFLWLRIFHYSPWYTYDRD